MSKLTKLVRNPALFYKDYAKKKRQLRDISSLEKPVFAFRVNDWKRNTLEAWFPEKDFIYVPFKATSSELTNKWLPFINQHVNAEVMVWGKNLPEELIGIQANVTYVEDGFIRSVGLGSHHTQPMSLCFDGKSPYFDANNETDLEDILSNHVFDDELMNRALQLKGKIIENNISKYNHNVKRRKVLDLDDKPKILVVGQVEDDASIIHGCEANINNNDLVNIAVSENPNFEIIYKPHPDVISKKRHMLSDPKEVENIATVIYEDLSIGYLLSLNISRVYTITSQVGIEALIRNIPVTVLGSPFYAGWGVTDDRQVNTRRNRELTVDEIFAASYILYPQYFDPYRKKKVEVEDVVNLIISNLSLSYASQVKLNNQSKDKPLLVTLSGEIDAGKKSLYLFGFGLQKISFFVSQFEDQYNVFTFDMPVSKQVTMDINSIISTSRVQKGDVFVIWGKKDPYRLESTLLKMGVEVRRVEDAFIRSIGLGGFQPIPLSYIYDDLGIYFDSTNPSRLEDILNTYDFTANPELLERANNIILDMVESGTSKYNFKDTRDVAEVYGEKTSKRILVIGQVEDDASIVYGCSQNITNNELVMMAKVENPDAQIIYKPHPDVLSGLRKRVSDPTVVENVSLVLYEQLSLADSFKTIDHVYTITSLSGFEALLRGISVTTVGAPFYSGWGLTDDRQVVDRRKRTLSLAEVFAAAYILYPVYVNPFNSKKISPEEALKLLTYMKDNDVHPMPAPSLIGNSQSHIKKITALIAEGKTSDALVLSNASISAYGDADSYLLRAKTKISSGDIGDKTLGDLKYSCELTGWNNKKYLLVLSKYLWEFKGYCQDLHFVLSKLKKVDGLNHNDKLMLAAMYADGGYIDASSSLIKTANLSSPIGYLKLSYIMGGSNNTRQYSSLEAKKLSARINNGVKEFESYIVNNPNSFCVVGNSPAELNKNKGYIIDGFDKVIRFNDFNTSYPYSKDYGSKVSYWVRMPKNIGLGNKKVDDIIISGSAWESRLPDGIETFSTFFMDYSSVSTIPFDIYKRLCEELGAAPSAGLQILYWIYSLIGKIPQDQVFGFSLVDQAEGKNSHYASSKSVSVRHNWIKERVIFDRIISEVNNDS